MFYLKVKNKVECCPSFKFVGKLSTKATNTNEKKIGFCGELKMKTLRSENRSSVSTHPHLCFVTKCFAVFNIVLYYIRPAYIPTFFIYPFKKLLWNIKSVYQPLTFFIRRHIKFGACNILLLVKIIPRYTTDCSGIIDHVF